MRTELVVVVSTIGLLCALAAVEMYRKYFPKSHRSSGMTEEQFQEYCRITERIKRDALEVQKPKPKKKEPVYHCVLSVTMTNNSTEEWSNTSWTGVAREFYSWYFGRPQSECFIMKSIGKDDQRSRQTVILRKNIYSIHTFWRVKA